MKHSSKYIILLFLGITFLYSCSNSEDPLIFGEGSLSDSADSDTTINIMIVNTENIIGELYPFWNTKPMINQNRFNSATFRNSLEDIKPYTTHFNLVRMLGGRTDKFNQYYKGVDESGKVITDFSGMITSMRNFMLTGFKPRLVLDNVPWDMSEEQENNRYGNTNPPANYNLWRQYIQAFLRALIDEFGYDEVKTWRMRVGTEPNYFPHHWNGTKEQYLRHYDETVHAVTSIIPEIEIGPGNIILNQSDSNWGMDIIDHCASGTNYVTGEVGTRMDFFCVSYYEFLKQNTVKLEGFMTEINARLDKHPKFANIPLDIQEFGILKDENNNDGLSLNDGSEYGASWYATISDIVYRQGISEIYEWGLDVQNGLPSPRSHVVSMLRKMENGSRLSVQGTPEGFSGLISVRKEGKIYLLVYNHEPERTSNATKNLSPRITGNMIRNSKNWTLNEWTLDQQHGEFLHELYEDCISAGVGIKADGRIYGTRPDDYFEEGWEAVFTANKDKYSELAAMPQTRSNESLKVESGALQLQLHLNAHSVKLLELSPQ
ncbi:GH39 family glycosyl hydrolase [Echinicola pacifica]|nr:hypothetical protein [Echinicola pacifica]